MEDLFLIIMWGFAIWLIAILFGGGGSRPELEKSEPEKKRSPNEKKRKKAKRLPGFFVFGKLPSEKGMKKANY